MGSITGFQISPGGGNGNPLQYSHLKNPMDRGAWQATVQKDCKHHGLRFWFHSKEASRLKLALGFIDSVTMMAQQVKNPPTMQETQETWVQSLGQEDALEEEMATRSRILT